MVQESYIWDVDGPGDSSLMPYSQSMVYLWWYMMLMHDTSYEGVIAGIDDELMISNPSGQAVRISTGSALVHGTFYWNDENLDFIDYEWQDYTSTYYRFVLRKSWTPKTVRAAMLGPSYSGYPALTQVNGTTWEISIADVEITAGGVVNITDQRHFLHTNECRTLKMPLRHGNSANLNWNSPTTDVAPKIFVQHTAKIMTGCKQWTGAAASSGAVVLTFPVAFTYAPVVVIQPINTLAQIMTAVQTTTTQLTIYWKDEVGTNRTSLDFVWMAAGPIIGGYGG